MNGLTCFCRDGIGQFCNLIYLVKVSNVSEAHKQKNKTF